MSVQRERQSEPVVAPIVGAGWLLSLAGAAVSLPVDTLLRGMVAAGQGIQAILDYLGLSRMALEAHIVRLGLPMPHDRPRRRAGGPHPWTDEDVRRLIAWRLTGVHPESIGLRLGRSVGSIRSKSRRLGVPTPDRRSLRKVDPADLADSTTDLWVGQQPSQAFDPTPSQRCGTAAGAPSVGGVNHNSITEPDAAYAVAAGAVAPAQGALDLGNSDASAASVQGVSTRARRGQGARQSGNRKQGQRELGLLQVVAGTDIAEARVPIPATHRDVDLAGDLTWMGRMSSPQKNEIYVWTLGLLFMSGLHWREIAERIGRKPGAVRTMRTNFGIPVAKDRRLLTMEFDECVGKMTCVISKYIVKRCVESGLYFWCHRDDRACKTAPAVRRKKGLRDQRIEGRSPVFRLLSRAEIDRLPRHLIEPFANNERIVGIA